MIKDVSDYKIVEDFISELKVMMYLGQHSNVLNLLGVVTSNITQNELMIIVEYCEYGNVSDLLRNNRSQFINQINFKYDIIDSTIRKRNKIYAKRLTSNCDNSTDEISNKLTIEPITTTDLVYWSLQVAQGMDYLTSRKILHRDLAARNILLCPNNVVKICDFGMARILQNDEYHIEHRRELIPFKYWPPESLQKQKFSVYSDVWSFGIVMWEMFSLGSPPYPDVDSFSELCKRLDDGYRLSKPLYATEAIYNIMISCWNDDHKLRPLFDLLEMNISQLLHPVFSSSMESFECESDKDDCKYGSRSLEYSCSSSNRNNK
ncbi:platelet-derived growth factor receptor beta-like [Contarinia nasturtii]|uniref:platelet-derived growth factor receptor beta-like n=1 Tax=Contarinia nasturtii TaxID=265458 RepID=UPI0012D3B0C7|nr:platelet-derived growth factor receptor beta-like [Contarinia nasturtii]